MNLTSNSASKQNLAAAVRQSVNPVPNLYDKISNALKATQKECSDEVKVWLGYQKSNNIQLIHLDFDLPLKTDQQSIDNLFAEIVLRSRDITKNIFSSFSLGDGNFNFANQLTQYGKYKFGKEAYIVQERLIKNVPINTVVFYLDSQTNWRVLANTPDLLVTKPTPFVNILHEYYINHYPKEVVDACFSDSKNPLRVYAVEEHQDVEIFHLELLFKEDDIDKIIKVPVLKSEV